MYQIVKESKILDLNSSYSYLMWGKFFNHTSIVAELDDEIIGFITGFIQPNSPDTLFIWQIAVEPHHRGNGLASKLIKQLLKQNDVKYLEATVTPSNIPSNRLFQGIARNYKVHYVVEPCFLSEQFPDSHHEEEVKYRIGPFQSKK